MRAVIQRVSQAQVTVDQQVIGKIKHGIVILLGITHDDDQGDADYLIRKITHLRIYEDDQHKMNQSIIDIAGEVLSISQFTLYADTKKGRRPNFMGAARPELAEPLYNYFNAQLRDSNLKVETGVFGEMMEVSLINDGPVTIMIDSADR
ncbi:D-tyrosyl-tRNA(Tyr) deacylase [Amphibacillus marinus]|uniref:D-aminoacyl-tRNA deacylase n=1 Tax=Amphibacillus marinus TaxID=872970 RepID=A0A1H8NYP8_9BACI|nr:D-aminoacyl-tRNA deacylase [Amphibacillus marinus]SEO34745.1 D-tyrosyl-tRNA(Tyr) deacylase [Amphibacillus marinus]